MRYGEIDRIRPPKSHIQHLLMGMFSNLMSKIFGHTTASSAASPASGAPVTASDVPKPTTAAPSASPATVSPKSAVDVNAVLNDMAAKSSEKLDWKTSIV